MRKLLPLLALATFCLLSARGNSATSHLQSGGAILLDQFETVFYSQADLLSDLANGTLPSNSVRRSLRLPFRLLLDALDSKDPRVKSDILKNASGILVGARDFRGPKGLGAVRSQSCYIMLLINGNRLDLSKHFGHSSALANEGTPIWTWSAKLNEFGALDPQPSILYATQVEQSYISVCNDLENLRLIASLLRRAQPVMSPAERMPGWQVVMERSYWGYRHYHHGGAVDRGAAGLALGPHSEITLAAQDLMFWVDDSKEKLATLRLLAKDENTASNINSLIRRDDPLLLLSPVSPNMWDAKIDLSMGERSNLALFHVMILFGFGIYV